MGSTASLGASALCTPDLTATLEFQSWTVNTVAFIMQDQRQYTEAKTPGLI